MADIALDTSFVAVMVAGIMVLAGMWLTLLTYLLFKAQAKIKEVEEELIGAKKSPTEAVPTQVFYVTKAGLPEIRPKEPEPSALGAEKKLPPFPPPPPPQGPEAEPIPEAEPMAQLDELEAILQQLSFKCPYCREKIEMEWKFCPNCDGLLS